VIYLRLEITKTWPKRWLCVCVCVCVWWGWQEVGGSRGLLHILQEGTREKTFILLEDNTNSLTHTYTHTHARDQHGENVHADFKHAFNSLHLISCGPELFSAQEARGNLPPWQKVRMLWKTRRGLNGRADEKRETFLPRALSSSFPLSEGCWVLVYSENISPEVLPRLGRRRRRRGRREGEEGGGGGMHVVMWRWDGGIRGGPQLSAREGQRRAAGWALLPFRVSQVDHKLLYTRK